ncbi:unnamed protein product [Mytilus edulis]|uniref:Uncharacterized protein n=1 Tax=Mytilus edulis TaxID=6550 RepID=A0A8S3RCU3_MYTED|nr:unnamed protein product [Mytilus edulis]
MLRTVIVFCLLISVYGQNDQQCFIPENRTCQTPGYNVKGCLCSCFKNITVNTDYLQINFSNCVAVLHTCSFYKLWFDIIFLDQNGKVIALKEETYVNHNRKEKSQTFPLYKLSKPLEKRHPSHDRINYIKLQLMKNYTVLIKPHCTACDNSCSNIRHYIKGVRNFMTSTVLPENPNKGATWKVLVIVAGVFVLSIILSVFIFTKRRRHFIKNVDSSSRLIEQNRNDRNVFGKLYIVPLSDADPKHVENLEQWFHTKTTCRLVQPEHLMMKCNNGRLNMERDFSNDTVILVVLTNNILISFLRQCYDNSGDTWNDSHFCFLQNILESIESFPLMYFVTFDSEMKRNVLNFDFNNKLNDLMQRLIVMSNCPAEQRLQLDRVLNFVYISNQATIV